MVSQQPLWEAPSDCIIPTYLTAHKFRVIYPEGTDWNNPSNLFSENSLVFYTDGSVGEGLAGYGIYSANPEFSISASLGHFSTVFQSAQSKLRVNSYLVFFCCCWFFIFIW